MNISISNNFLTMVFVCSVHSYDFEFQIPDNRMYIYDTLLRLQALSLTL